MSEQKVWFITGASSGLGRELAKAALASGDIVVACARRIERLQDIVTDTDGKGLAIVLDVTDTVSRVQALQAALDRFGRIDVLANVAGRGINGAAEELDIAQVRDAFEVNCFGAIELTRLVLPHMRAARSGHILNVSSIVGLVAVPDLGVYCATKFALEAWTEALAGEVRDLGIRVTLVEPGGFRTEFEGDTIVRPAIRIPDYAPIVGPIEKQLSGNAGRQLGNPEIAASIMVEAVKDNGAPLRLVLGSDAHAMWAAASTRTSADILRWKDRCLSTDYADIEQTIL
ncbi:oxidoreductase [Gluconobacter kanchanaburiensis]|uniref:Short-chain dehydrogenase/reductase n=1 Tax=Gluconobacter kanchanaburiensis NBRC 103587 TaxID=1307948 RepID=A0A511B689_9PROT|nr:oxidoreductase [Gluconobacter kanchanaburiensis]MBF0861517.1 SDR family NAD(P)-dependent oxidoreductase [Gluconobacter kanchanaburiensis]GBR66885.1 short-chain dehydrogenase/reductase SDR [Gluconobacter kanchanaburiensis NBRC 103587]GEK95151.1 short-chain dehydrogenase/reductase [Gluconobacter kanchanaburiensis NBRC 103587]